MSTWASQGVIEVSLVESLQPDSGVSLDSETPLDSGKFSAILDGKERDRSRPKWMPNPTGQICTSASDST